MPEKTIHSSLRETFPRVNKKMWQRAASQEIKGEDPFAQLAWNTQDDIAFSPYYDHHDTAHLEYLKKFQLAASENSYLGPRKWLCVPRVPVNGEALANKISLDHLKRGADGVLFDILTDTTVSTLLQQIEWPFCSLFFHAADNHFFTENLPVYIRQNAAVAQSFSGALFWESSPKKGDVDFYLKTTQNLYSLGLVIQPSSPVREVADALTQGVTLIEKLSVTNHETLFRAVAFSIPVGTLFFESVAILKALRLLWYQVSQAYDIKSYKPSDLHIHARSAAWITKNFEPHGNMIKSTTAAMASVMGGCDSLTVEPQDAHNSTMDRIARNVSAALREESHLDKVADPLSGSYATDIMVHEIATRAWALFQSNMK